MSNATFTNLLKTQAKSALTSAICNASGSGPVSKTLEAVRRYKDYLVEQDCLVTNVLTALSQTPEILSDASMDVTSIKDLSEMSVKDRVGQVSKDVADLIFQSFRDVITDDVGVSFTHVNGMLLRFEVSENFDFNSPAILVNGIPWIFPMGTGPGGDMVYAVDQLLHGSQEVDGMQIHVSDFIRGQVENATLNSNILSVIQTALGNWNDPSSVYTTIYSGIRSTISSVSSTFSKFKLALDRGGIYGLLCTILGMAKSVASVEASDGFMQFTDNFSFTPVDFIAGFIGEALSLIANVVTIIVSKFNVILGVAIGLIGQLVSNVVKAIEYSSDQVRASTIDDYDVLPGSTPFGFFQGEVPADGSIGLLVQDSQTLIQVDVPGGFFILGPGGLTTEGVVNVIRYEFHVVVADYTAVMDVLFHDWQVVVTTAASMSSGYVSTTLAADDIDVPAFMEIVSGNIASPDILNEDATGLVSSTTDEFIRNAISDGLALFTVYCMMCYGSGTGMISLGDVFYNKPRSFNIISGSYDSNVVFGYATPYAIGADTMLQPVFAHCGSALHAGSVATCSGQAPSWADLPRIATMSAQLGSSYPNAALLACSQLRLFYNSPVSHDRAVRWAVQTPKYDSRTFWMNLVLFAVGTTLAAAAAIVTTIAVKKSITRTRALNEVKVAQAYDNLQKSPSSDTYKAYRKAVKKNNAFSKIFGGSKFDLESYWHGDVSSTSSTADTGSTPEYSNIASLLGVGNDSLVSIDSIKALICGS